MRITTRFDGECTVVAYNSRDSIVVKFNDGTDVITTVSQICRRSIKNPMKPSVYGVGYMGIGKYNTVNAKQAHVKWTGMLERCYCDKYHLTKPTYIGCVVDSEWLNFQEFASWFNNQKFESGWHLDKDLKVQGNKVYAPATCSLVPAEVNNLTVGTKNRSIFVRVAEKWKGSISEEVYGSIMNWRFDDNQNC